MDSSIAQIGDNPSRGSFLYKHSLKLRKREATRHLICLVEIYCNWEEFLLGVRVLLRGRLLCYRRKISRLRNYLKSISEIGRIKKVMFPREWSGQGVGPSWTGDSNSFSQFRQLTCCSINPNHRHTQRCYATGPYRSSNIGQSAQSIYAQPPNPYLLPSARHPPADDFDHSDVLFNRVCNPPPIVSPPSQHYGGPGLLGSVNTAGLSVPNIQSNFRPPRNSRTASWLQEQNRCIQPDISTLPPDEDFPSVDPELLEPPLLPPPGLATPKPGSLQTPPPHCLQPGPSRPFPQQQQQFPDPQVPRRGFAAPQPMGPPMAPSYSLTFSEPFPQRPIIPSPVNLYPPPGYVDVTRTPALPPIGHELKMARKAQEAARKQHEYRPFEKMYLPTLESLREIIFGKSVVDSHGLIAVDQSPSDQTTPSDHPTTNIKAPENYPPPKDNEDTMLERDWVVQVENFELSAKKKGKQPALSPPEPATAQPATSMRAPQQPAIIVPAMPLSSPQKPAYIAPKVVRPYLRAEMATASGQQIDIESSNTAQNGASSANTENKETPNPIQNGASSANGENKETSNIVQIDAADTAPKVVGPRTWAQVVGTSEPQKDNKLSNPLQNGVSSEKQEEENENKTTQPAQAVPTVSDAAPTTPSPSGSPAEDESGWITPRRPNNREQATIAGRGRGNRGQGRGRGYGNRFETLRRNARC
jgi:hypothetical protein